MGTANGLGVGESTQGVPMLNPYGMFVTYGIYCKGNLHLATGRCHATL